LPHAVESFLRQDYPRRELVILDDAGQYAEAIGGDRWRIISLSTRFPTLGEKRNALARFASPDAEVFAVWDDDDVYLPWHLSAAVRALANADVAIPSACVLKAGPDVRLHATSGLFHSSWVYRRTAFEAVGGYPAQNNGEDQVFGERLRTSGMSFADPCRFAGPSLVCRIDESTYHLSVSGRRGYENLPQQLSFSLVTEVTPHWDRDWVATCGDLEITGPSTLGT
jgi:hypothetical protein